MRHMHLITRRPGILPIPNASARLTPDEVIALIREGGLPHPHGLIAAARGEADAVIDRRAEGAWTAVTWCSSSDDLECVALCLGIVGKAENMRNDAGPPEPGRG